HRFYGESIPLENIDIALADIEVRGCLTSAQALMDFAEIILNVKKKFLQENAPVIVLGCSYSGKINVNLIYLFNIVLAAWFRLKYPHIAIGALASSAPVFYFDMDRAWDNTYCEVVSRDYMVVNEICYERIKKSWEMSDNIGSQGAASHAYLNKIFKSCTAQYNGRHNDKINSVCDEIVHAPEDDIIVAIARIRTAGELCLSLFDFLTINTSTSLDSNSGKAWDWQNIKFLLALIGCQHIMVDM
ncbi:Lysosomal Pro-X carboxypeptidase, partial [Bienertia sinuspersici]